MLVALAVIVELVAVGMQDVEVGLHPATDSSGLPRLQTSGHRVRPSPLPKFFQIVRSEQASWCRQASQTFPRQVRRRSSRWVSGGQWISNKHARCLDRTMCFTGVLFIDGKLIPSHSWPKPPGITSTERRKTMNTANANSHSESTP